MRRNTANDEELTGLLDDITDHITKLIAGIEKGKDRVNKAVKKEFLEGLLVSLESGDCTEEIIEALMIRQSVTTTRYFAPNHFVGSAGDVVRIKATVYPCKEGKTGGLYRRAKTYCVNANNFTPYSSSPSSPSSTMSSPTRFFTRVQNELEDMRISRSDGDVERKSMFENRAEK